MPLIAFVGCDGSGKSTLVRSVAHELRRREYRVEVVDKWDIFDPLLHPECEFLGASSQAFKKCVSQMQGPGRAMLIFWMIAQTTSRISAPPDRRSGRETYFLLDGYWMKHAAAEMVRATDPELIDTLVGTLPPADATFFLDLDPQHAAMRKNGDASPYECGLSSGGAPRDFIGHQTKLRDVLRDWAALNKWHQLDAQHAPDALTQIVLQRLLQQRGSDSSPRSMNICQHSLNRIGNAGNVRVSGEQARP